MTHFAQQVPEAVVGKGVVDGGDGGAGDQICSLEGWEGGMGWEGEGKVTLVTRKRVSVDRRECVRLKEDGILQGWQQRNVECM